MRSKNGPCGQIKSDKHKTMEEKFIEIEDNNGIRMSWHAWPTNRIDTVSCSVPIGVLYTPLKQIPNREPLPYKPVFCRCRAVLNSFCHIDYTSHVWTCPVCGQRNQLPDAYHGMTPENLPAELHPDYTTVEYTLVPTSAQQPCPPVFLFVVDTCTAEREIENLKSQLVVAIANLPPESYVGFVTFGTLVYIHELKPSDFPRSHVFSGNKVYTVPELRGLLGLVEGVQNPFFLPAEEAEVMLESLVDKLETDSFRVPKGERPPRCTGAAMHIATTLLEASFPQSGGQVFVFTSGPITKGPGVMASLKIGEAVRQHSDIEKNTAPMTTSAVQFFTQLGAKASEKGIVINYMSASFEETGLYEVEPCILNTGGWLTSSESWSEENITQTIIKYFTGIYPVCGSDCSVCVLGTKNFKVAGCIGPCTSTNNRENVDLIGEKPIGNGGTTEWKVCGILPTTTLAFFIDISASKADPVPNGSTAIMQFLTKYRHVKTGSLRLRVTTYAVKFADLTSSFHLISQSFDQQAAAVLLARYATWKVRTEDLLDVVHHVDRTLIRFCRKFGTYNKGDPASFALSSQFVVFPQFLYHLRRSPFMSTFNSSPDLTTSLRHSLLLEEVTNSLFMIQPTLLQYNLDQQPIPVALDMGSLQRNCVLLLDTFFRVVVWNGADIAAWRNLGYQNQPEYENLKTILEAPVEEAKAFIEERFPTPTLVVCDQDSGLSRYLLTRCNPSTQGFGGGGQDSLGTDEPSFARFSQKLKEVAVND